MESIKKFENYKIGNMQYVTGGREVIPTNSGSATNISDAPDKAIYTNGGCTLKVVKNLGFSNWITGKRETVSYDVCADDTTVID